MIFDFKEVENRTIDELEKRIEELDNQVKHWRSMYNKEVKERPIIVKYANEKEENKRIRSILKLHHDTKDLYFKNMIIEELYLAYGVIKEPSSLLLDWWKRKK